MYLVLKNGHRAKKRTKITKIEKLKKSEKWCSKHQFKSIANKTWLLNPECVKNHEKHSEISYTKIINDNMFINLKNVIIIDMKNKIFIIASRNGSPLKILTTSKKEIITTI